MKQFMFIIIYFIISPIVVLAQNSNVEVSYNIQANVKFVDESTIINEKVNRGEKLIEPSHKEKKGYVFLGWFNNGERWDFANNFVTSHVTLNAKYKAVDNIVFDMTNDINNFLQSAISIDYDDIIISDKEKEYLANNHILNVWLEINDVSNSISSDEKEKIDKIAKKQNLDIDYYLDINLYKQIDDIDDTKEQVHDTNRKIKVSLVLPENIRHKNRKYFIIRLHDGIAEEIYSGVPNKNWELVFETNKFSSYAIAHSKIDILNNINPKTGDNMDLYIWLLLISFIGLVSLIFLIKKKPK